MGAFRTEIMRGAYVCTCDSAMQVIFCGVSITVQMEF